MDENTNFAEKYCKKIYDYLSKGYARKLSPNELEDTDNTWYLPHFSVMTANKFRLVMDAKAKSNGFSLNDLLFHQIFIRAEDQNSQRFYWRGMDRTKKPDIYVMVAMIFGAVSSQSIAQFVKNFNAQELEEKLPGVLRAIVEQHYVDDYFDGRDTVEEAVRMIEQLITAQEVLNW